MEPIVSPCFCIFLLFYIRSFRHNASFAVRFKNKQTDYVALFLIRIDIQDTGHVDIERKETECYDERGWKHGKEHEINQKGNARNIRRYELGFDQLNSLQFENESRNLALRS